MMAWLTPRRRRGVEILDDPDVPDAVRSRAMADVARSNRYFGGRRAVAAAVRRIGATLTPTALMLDVGTGTGDIAAAVRRSLPHIRFSCIGLDMSEVLLRTAAPSIDAGIAGDALRLPLRDGCVDLVVCSQVLHHFEAADAERLIAELHRVSRGSVLIADLGRSWIAAAGFWLAASALRFHPITRADGVTSVLRGFTAEELGRLVQRATGKVVQVHRESFWRLTAVWHARGPAA